MRHVKSLDGIRGLAVSLVVLFHAGLAGFGWIGVQIFFVLSGYLITSILVESRQRGFAEYLGRFYWRRSLRIFPLYFAFLAASAMIFVALGTPESFNEDWPWLATYTANFARLRQTDLGPAFVHLWSLAVEEQFYLVWPLVVFFLNRDQLKKAVILILVLAPAGRLAVYLAFAPGVTDWLGRTIYSLPTSQIDAFAAGAAITFLDSDRPWRWAFLSLGAGLLAGAGVLAHQHFAHHAAMKWSFGYAMFLMQDGGLVWGYSTLNIIAALGIAAAVKSPPHILQTAPIVRIGAISYGIYIYHLPLLLAIEQLDLPRSALLAAYLGLVYLVAELSFRFLETPFLRLKDRPPFVAGKQRESAIRDERRAVDA